MTACSGSPSTQLATTTTSSPVPASSTTTTPVPAGPVRGALPNGTIYDIAFDSPRDEEIVTIEAGLVVDDDEVLHVSIRRDHIANGSDSTLKLRTEGWVVDIDVPASDHEIVGESIEVSTEVGMPVMELHPPLRWSGAQHVVYESFVVSSGCPDRATLCNETHAVSVVPRDGFEPVEPVSIQSYALRPSSDPNHVDPGPLSARWSPDVLWSGEEMIVWGGSTSPGTPHLIDGAAYDPDDDRWRLLPDPPLVAERPTRAVWAGDEMIVVAEEATLAWDPATDAWEVIAAGIVPPMEPGLIWWTGSEVLTWPGADLRSLAPGAADWGTLPDPGVGEPGFEGSVLRMAGQRLLAIGQDGCDRLLVEWGEGKWSRPIRVAVGVEPPCGHPGQTAVAGGSIVMWDDSTGNVVSYDPATGETLPLAPFPVAELERPPGPLQLDDGFLVTSGLEGAIFRPENETWDVVEIPGLGSDADMVWTGEEVLMWGKCCYGPDDVDAWRWAPPTP